MFAAIKNPLSLAAVVALTAACSSGGVTLPTLPAAAPQAAVPAVTVPVLVSTPSVETAVPAYQAAPVYSTPTLAATQAPLAIEGPAFIDAAPVIDSSLIQPASVSTFNTTAPTLSAPALPAYTIPPVPSAPVVSPEYLNAPTIAPITDGFSQLPTLGDTSIIAASARESGLPTTLGDIAPIAK